MAMKMINSRATRGILANFQRNKLFPAVASSQKLTLSTTAAGNQKATLMGGDEDPEIRMSPFSRMKDLVMPTVSFVKDLMHILEFRRNNSNEVEYEVKLNTKLWPSLKKLLKKSPVRVAPGNEGTTYFIPIPGISVDEDDELSLVVFRSKLGVFASRDPDKVGGDLSYLYWVDLPDKDFTKDDLTVVHANGVLSVFVPHQKKKELAGSKKEGQLEEEDEDDDEMEDEVEAGLRELDHGVVGRL